MTYKLKGGEEIKDGKLYGWTGSQCVLCNGYGEVFNTVYGIIKRCDNCAGTGEEWGLMPVQPNELKQ